MFPREGRERKARCNTKTGSISVTSPAIPAGLEFANR
jgi:hypothetical protein